MTTKVRVLVVDDSPFFQRRICEILRKDERIEVIGTASDGRAAITAARRLKPNVITMDVEMPVLDGISAVKEIMAAMPTPIIMFSALTHEGAKSTLGALEAGAVDFLPKQFVSARPGRKSATDLLPDRVVAVAKRPPYRSKPAAKPLLSSRPSQAVTGCRQRNRYKLIAIGASTGGPIAIQELLSVLPAGFPLPILLIVHMPANFTRAYAERLDATCRISVKEAEDGDRLQPGRAFLAPGGRQMVLESAGSSAVIRVSESLPDQTYKPSVDVSLGSAARVYPNAVLAIVLTGMGADGKQGARLLKQGGSSIWSQSEESCVVYGMPQAVEKAGLSDRVLPLSEIGPALETAL